MLKKVPKYVQNNYVHQIIFINHNVLSEYIPTLDKPNGIISTILLLRLI